MKEYRITENTAGKFREASYQTVGFAYGKNKQEALENFKKAFSGKEDNDSVVHGGLIRNIRNVRAEVNKNI